MRKYLPLATTISAAIAAAAMFQTTVARSDILYYDPNTYVAQQTSYYCGIAAMEMMINSPVVANNNTYIQANGLPSQNYLYTASRPYNATPMNGTDPIAVATTLNYLDNPNAPYFGYGNPGNVYAWGGFSPTQIGAYYASRTVANALVQYGVPASVVVENGAHWIDVNGVTVANGSPAPAFNTNYTITGFTVRDPWTGYALAHPAPNQPMGLGFNTWLRYGYDASGRQGYWFNLFNPVTLPRNTPYNLQYNIVVDPQGPESLDTGGPNNTYYSLPAPPALLGSDLTAGGADADAAPDISADGLGSDFNAPGGNWDSSDEMLLTDPGDPTASAGDWLVPYDGSGGVNDVLGAALIDAETGVLDEATWLDPSQGDPSSITLSQLDAMFVDQADNNLPQDDLADSLIPEPTTLSLLLPAMGMLMLRKRKVN